jgi:hypothetical protein
VLLHRATSRFANFSSAGRQLESTMNSSNQVLRQCLGVIRAVSAAAVCTFVTGASAQACGARVGPGIASLPSPSESGVADGNAAPGPGPGRGPSMLEACRLRLGCHCQCEGACWGAAASTAHAYGRAGPPGPMLQGAGEAACESDPSPTAGTQGSAACAVYKPEVRVWHSRRIQGSKRALDLPTAQHIYRRLFSFGFRFRFGFRVRVNRVF